MGCSYGRLYAKKQIGYTPSQSECSPEGKTCVASLACVSLLFLLGSKVANKVVWW